MPAQVGISYNFTPGTFCRIDAAAVINNTTGEPFSGAHSDIRNPPWRSWPPPPQLRTHDQPKEHHETKVSLIGRFVVISTLVFAVAADHANQIRLYAGRRRSDLISDHRSNRLATILVVGGG
jgi:hypothetical protein